jgi:hypothetical protein
VAPNNDSTSTFMPFMHWDNGKYDATTCQEQKIVSKKDIKNK